MLKRGGAFPAAPPCKKLRCAHFCRTHLFFFDAPRLMVINSARLVVPVPLATSAKKQKERDKKMPSKSIKTEGAVARTAKIQTKPKVAARRTGNTNNGETAAPPAKKRKAKPAISTEDIALRAYFIAEKRRTAGIPGDELGDWVEAERQLLVEKEPK